jgi:hypothetical protein
VNILQCNCLRADVPSAEGIVFVAADGKTLIGLMANFDATDRLAEIAIAIMKRAVVGSRHGKLTIGDIRGKFAIASRDFRKKECEA